MAPMWDRIDPLAEKYYGISPYAYCGGDPVNRGDYDGREPTDSVDVRQNDSNFDIETAMSHTSIYLDWVGTRHEILETQPSMIKVPKTASRALSVAPVFVNLYNAKQAETAQEKKEAMNAAKWDAIGFACAETTSYTLSECGPFISFGAGAAVGLTVSNFGPKCEQTYDETKAFVEEKANDVRTTYKAAKIITKIGVQIYNRYFK